MTASMLFRPQGGGFVITSPLVNSVTKELVEESYRFQVISQSLVGDSEGDLDGFSVGLEDGSAVGNLDMVGLADGALDGTFDGFSVGLVDGFSVGNLEGVFDGFSVGLVDGFSVGISVGLTDGFSVGNLDGFLDGFSVGLLDGARDGLITGEFVVQAPLA